MCIQEEYFNIVVLMLTMIKNKEKVSRYTHNDDYYRLLIGKCGPCVKKQWLLPPPLDFYLPHSIFTSLTRFLSHPRLLPPSLYFYLSQSPTRLLTSPCNFYLLHSISNFRTRLLPPLDFYFSHLIVTSSTQLLTSPLDFYLIHSKPTSQLDFFQLLPSISSYTSPLDFYLPYSSSTSPHSTSTSQLDFYLPTGLLHPPFDFYLPTQLLPILPHSISTFHTRLLPSPSRLLPPPLEFYIPQSTSTSPLANFLPTRQLPQHEPATSPLACSSSFHSTFCLAAPHRLINYYLLSRLLLRL